MKTQTILIKQCTAVSLLSGILYASGGLPVPTQNAEGQADQSQADGNTQATHPNAEPEVIADKNTIQKEISENSSIRSGTPIGPDSPPTLVRGTEVGASLPDALGSDDVRAQIDAEAYLNSSIVGIDAHATSPPPGDANFNRYLIRN